MNTTAITATDLIEIALYRAYSVVDRAPPEARAEIVRLYEAEAPTAGEVRAALDDLIDGADEWSSLRLGLEWARDALGPVAEGRG